MNPSTAIIPMLEENRTREPFVPQVLDREITCDRDLSGDVLNEARALSSRHNNRIETTQKLSRQDGFQSTTQNITRHRSSNNQGYTNGNPLSLDCGPRNGSHVEPKIVISNEHPEPVVSARVQDPVHSRRFNERSRRRPPVSKSTQWRGINNLPSVPRNSNPRVQADFRGLVKSSANRSSREGAKGKDKSTAIELQTAAEMFNADSAADEKNSKAHSSFWANFRKRV